MTTVYNAIFFNTPVPSWILPCTSGTDKKWKLSHKICKLALALINWEGCYYLGLFGFCGQLG